MWRASTPCGRHRLVDGALAAAAEAAHRVSRIGADTVDASGEGRVRVSGRLTDE
jgi:hypothetical protein